MFCAAPRCAGTSPSQAVRVDEPSLITNASASTSFLSPSVPGQLSAYTFIDEEIHALAAAGVDAFVLSTRATGDTQIGAVKLRSLPSSSSLRDRAQTTAFALEGRAAIPVANVWHARELYRAMAIERFAAEIVGRGRDRPHSQPLRLARQLRRDARGRRDESPARRVPAWRRHSARRSDRVRAAQ